MTVTLRTLILLASLLAATASIGQPVGPAIYEVSFQATWSAATHPSMFPPNPHFSWLIGGTHDDQVSFWDVGTTASLGIRRMAEWGSTSPLDTEVQAAISAGHGGEVIESDAYPMSPGSVSTLFTADPATPLATVVTMVAPSPDWFTGVNGLDLRDGNDWAAVLTVDVYPYDAGTDSGTNYTSGDQPTVPQDPIAAITGAPFTPGVPVGTMTFTLLGTTDVVPAPGLALRSYPNPFNPRTTVAFTVPGTGRADVSIHDMRGRKVRTLFGGIASAGDMTLEWNGRNEQGQAVPSGTYLARLVVGGRQATTRLVLVR